MTSQSINSIEELLQLIVDNSNGYYIKQKNISSFNNKDGHTIYSKFKYFDDSITKELLQEHLKNKITLAISLDSYKSMVFEYYGDRKEAFVALLKYFLNEEGIKNIFITNSDSSKITIFSTLFDNNTDFFVNLEKKIKKKLYDRLMEDWRVLPDSSRPKIGNLLTLPRELIKV